MGRPSDFTPEIAELICERIADGQSIREIGRADDMPAASTIFRWLSAHESFQEQYARAKQAQAENLAEEILDIADDASNDWMRRNADEDAGWVENGEAIQRSRLRVDSRKWLLSKLLPKKYGDKVTQELTGANGGALSIVHRIERTIVDPNPSDPDSPGIPPAT